MAVCCGAIWHWIEKRQHRCTTTIPHVHNRPKNIWENLLPVWLLVRTNLFIPSRFWTTYTNFDNCLRYIVTCTFNSNGHYHSFSQWEDASVSTAETTRRVIWQGYMLTKYRIIHVQTVLTWLTSVRLCVSWSRSFCPWTICYSQHNTNRKVSYCKQITRQHSSTLNVVYTSTWSQMLGLIKSQPLKWRSGVTM